MNADELLLCADSKPNCDIMVKKERLYSLAVSGKSKHYLGTEMSWKQIQEMLPEDIETHYSRYESKLGSKMIQSLGRTLINLYAKAVGRFVDSEQELKYDLYDDPLLTRGLEQFGCDLYYRFGGFLAPLSMGLITFNHINFEKLNFKTDKNEHGGSEQGKHSEQGGSEHEGDDQ